MKNYCPEPDKDDDIRRRQRRRQQQKQQQFQRLFQNQRLSSSSSSSLWLLSKLIDSIKCLQLIAYRLILILLIHIYSILLLINLCDAFSININNTANNSSSSSSSLSFKFLSSTSSSSSSQTSSVQDNQTNLINPINNTIRKLLFRHKRDEEPAPIFGKGIAFWLGEHCETTCNRILFHVWCNSTTHRCECLPEYPVNVDNKYCLKALQINDRCEYSESCRFLNPNSECHPEQAQCKCMAGYFIKYEDDGAKSCVAYDSPFFIRIGSTTFDFINKIEFITLFSLIISFILIVILSMTVIKLMQKNKKLAKNDPTSFCDMIPPPPPVILNAQQQPSDQFPLKQSQQSSVAQQQSSRQTPQPPTTSSHHALQQYAPQNILHQQSSLPSSPSRMSPYHQDYSLQEKPPPLLPTNFNDFRRQSLSSLRSQSSTKSLSSFRSQHSYRIAQQQQHCQQHLSSSKIVPTSNILPLTTTTRSSNIHHESYPRFYTTRIRHQQNIASSPLIDSRATMISQSGYLLTNHLPPANIDGAQLQKHHHQLQQQHHSTTKNKCANHRYGTGSKVRSEGCLVHNIPEMLQEEIFVPTMKQ